MVKSLQYREDKSLTEHQRELKWSLYCEVETFEEIEDIELVLKSLLKDIEEQKEVNDGKGDI